MEDAICYLIGGAPRTGKTTLAKKVAEENNIKSLSTDSLLVMMTKIVRREDYPDLFYTQGLSVEEFYAKYDTTEKVVEASVKAGYEAEKGVAALIEHTLPAWKVIVVEGAVITPGFVKRLQEKYPKLSIRSTFLFDNDHERIKERIYTKGLWARDKPYSDSVKPNEVEYVVAYNEWFRSEAERYGFGTTKV